VSRLLKALVILCAMASPARAEDVTVMMMRYTSMPTPALPLDPKALRSMYAAGMCTARNLGFERLLGTVPGSQAEGKELFGGWYGTNECVRKGGRTILAPRLLRGIAAEYQLSETFELPSGRLKGRFRKLFQLPDNAALARIPAEARASIVFIEVGECVAKGSPVPVARLFSAAYMSDEERSAFKDLAPAIAGCLPGGIELKINKLQMRGYLAEGAYRNAVANQSGRN
jgi:hypothetical protein